MRLKIISIILVCLVACKASDYIVIEGNAHKIFSPPGTIKIKENFYADESELTNLDYREYIYWTLRVFGENSEEYLATLPDKTVWQAPDYTVNLKDKYFDHPMYNDYPIVGITLEQARKFTDWRTERVAEMLLIERKLVKPNYDCTAKDYFTLERYIEGNFDWIISKEDVLVPIYSIPTKDNWELIAGIKTELKSGIDNTTKYNKKVLKNFGHLQNSQEYHLSKRNKDSYYEETDGFVFTTNPVDMFGKNVFGLFGITGNVSELIENDGFCKGGNWKTKLVGNEIEKDISFDKANCWTGFRNIAKFEILKK